MKYRFAVIQTVRILIVLSLSSFALAEEEQVPNVPANPPIFVTDKNITKTIQLKMFKVTLIDGEETGTRSFGLFCANKVPVYMRQNSIALLKSNLSRTTIKTMEIAGYPRFEESESAFNSHENKSPDFQLGATIKSAQEFLCVSRNEATGGAYYKIFWELFSTKQQRVIFSKTTEGSFQTATSLKTIDIYDKAKTNAINNLLADPKFVALFQDIPEETQNPTGGEVLKIVSSPLPSGGTKKNISMLQKAVVTIENGLSSGSGFFIDKKGYLVTARHVVKNDKFVRVRLSSNETFPGEVIRSNAARDIALIKTAPVELQPLSIRSTPTEVAEEVYAIGSPINQKFAGTVSKGILSADRVFDGKNFLQSDVGVTHGSSGGPLLDAKGYVIGFTQSGIPQSGNINFFVPIVDALKKLMVEIQ